MPFLSNLGSSLKKTGESLGGALGDAVGGAVGGALGKAANKLPPLLRGPVKGLIGDVFGSNAGKAPIKVSNQKFLQDWRAYLVWPTEWSDSEIFKQLPKRDGKPAILFPFTPQVTATYTANYDMIHTVHTNMATPAYNNSGIEELQVSGEFVANTVSDANYVYSVIHFLKSATKSFNMAETKAELKGAPPPVLRFYYLGTSGYNQVPVVITSFNLTYPKEIDYVACGFGEGEGLVSSMVPSECTISVTLKPAYDRQQLVGNTKDETPYSTTNFINGKLIKTGHF